MDHIIHIQNNREYLDLRWEIIRLIREFFWSQNFVEVETPLLLRLPGQEPYLSPLKVSLYNEWSENFAGYLHTSPEYTLKKMLAAGYDKIFSLGKVFRDYESFGGTHNPEFTMIEWYRSRTDFYSLMDDVEKLVNFIFQGLEKNHKSKIINLKSSEIEGHSNKHSDRTSIAIEHLQHLLQHPQHFERIHMRDLWKEYVGVNLDEYLEKEPMFALCQQRGFAPGGEETYEDLFYRIFLNEIEPHLATRGGVMLHHYPKPMAALSRISSREPGYAERVEVYINDLELANGFGELTDADEQFQRLQQEQALRKKLGKDVYDIDTEFIESLRSMPPSAGMALGVDRLVQILAGCKNIEDVLPLPASKLFEA